MDSEINRLPDNYSVNRRSTGSIGHQSIASTDQDGNVRVSIKPGPLDATFIDPPEKTRGSFNNGSAHVEIDDPLHDINFIPEPVDEDFEFNKCTQCIENIHSALCGCCVRQKRILKTVIIITFLIAYSIYFGYAIWYNSSGALVVIVLTCIVAFYFIWKFVMKYAGERLYNCFCVPICNVFETRCWFYFRW